MSIACPYCKAALNPKGLKPGKFQPKCPKCAKPFVMVVPAEEGGTVVVQPVVAKAPDTAKTAKPAPKPKPRRTLTDEERAALLLEGKDPADYEDAAPAADANATGDFSEPEPPKPNPAPAPKPAPKPAVDPHATGDFTEPEPAPKKPAPRPAVDANATGDFTEASADPDATVARGPKPAADANVTGDFTQPGPNAKVDAHATGDFTEADAGAKKLKPAKAPKADLSADASEPLDADTPPRLGGYEVLKVLGKGGMGAVLLGRQISLDRKVALKVMHPKIAKNPAFVARFTREAYAAAQLTHHNVIQVYDIGEDGGQHFFSMEFVRGQSLMDLVKREGKLAAEVAVGYILQAARGLRYGHNQGMVHRDIKPDNLMLNTEGVVKVADLGLVKLGADDLPAAAGALPASEGDDGDTNLTRAGAVMGTPAYMSPEQSTDSGTVDHRADIYSLGCTLYVLITGKPPFEGKSALEIISKHQTEPIVPPEVVVKRVPPALSAILLKMMAKKPGDRHQTMDEVIAALEGFLGVERAGPFSPKEEQADQLEKCAAQYQVRSNAGKKRTLALGFVLACAVGIVGSALAGSAALAGGFVGLLFLAPLAYFTVHGTFTGSVVFRRVRAVVFGMRFFDWFMFAGGTLLFVLTLFLFGLLWAWLGFALVAVGGAFLLWFLTDRPAAAAQEAPLDEARGLLRTLRLNGLDEDAVRQFVCKFAGANWEPLYEALFGYEAMLAARASRKGDTGETWKRHATWRDPIVVWADAKVEARRLAKERSLLQKVEAKALEAEGVSKADAQAQAEEMAAQMQEQGAEAKQARKEGKEASVKALVTAARERRRPKPGVTIAGKQHRSLWLKDFVNNWFGRRLRFLLGAALFALGLLWLHQNGQLKGNPAFEALLKFDIAGAQKAFALPTQPVKFPGIDALPDAFLGAFNSWALPLTGLMVLLNAALYFGWRPTLLTLPGAALALFGPAFGIPDAGPLLAQHVSLIAGAIVILILARFVRQ